METETENRIPFPYFCRILYFFPFPFLPETENGILFIEFHSVSVWKMKNGIPLTEFRFSFFKWYGIRYEFFQFLNSVKNMNFRWGYISFVLYEQVNIYRVPPKKGQRLIAAQKFVSFHGIPFTFFIRNSAEFFPRNSVFIFKRNSAEFFPWNSVWKWKWNSMEKIPFSSVFKGIWNYFLRF